MPTAIDYYMKFNKSQYAGIGHWSPRRKPVLSIYKGGYHIQYSLGDKYKSAPTIV